MPSNASLGVEHIDDEVLEVSLEVGLDDVLLVVLPDAHNVGDALADEEFELRLAGGRVRTQEQPRQDLLHPEMGKITILDHFISDF